MTTVKNIYDFIDRIAPFDAQEEWDNSGFLIGEFRKEVKRVVMSLDATKSACEFAKGVGADLLITHHPAIFSGVKELKKGDAVYTLIENDIAQISAHTSFDIADDGINFNLAKILGLKNAKRIDDSFIVVGELDSPMSIDDLAEYVSERLDSKSIRFTDTDKLISTIALGGGACEEYTDLACDNADCFITGDMKYHPLLDASEKGQVVIVAGHFETENQPFLMLKERLEQVFTDVEFLIAPVNNPACSL